MSLVHNERTKLLANALDRMSTAFVAVGVLGQVFSLPPGPQQRKSLLAAFIWILAAAALHLAAHRVLGGLKS